MRKKCLWLATIFVLAACGGGHPPVSHDVTYIPPATPGGRMCMNQCNLSRDYCHQSCDLDNRACINQAQAAAQDAYDRYTRDRFASRAPADLMPSNFEKDDACIADKNSCYAACDHPYNSCYTSCGGTVMVTSSCTFLCFE